MGNTYQNLLIELKTKIKSAQIKAIISVNEELMLLYWRIGKSIMERQGQEGWGAKTIERLASDLKNEFPKIKGFSKRNLFYMKQFAENYPNYEIVQAAFAQLSWYHVTTLIAKVSEEKLRLWYAEKTLENGWSRDVMVHQIETNLHQRIGKATQNFDQTLSATQSDLAKATLKDPYIFDFLNIDEKIREVELENALVEHITKFLLELGSGFAFLGQQFPLEVSEKEYRLDLLFYHTKLRCYVAVDLKIGEFKPEYAGKMNFYLSALDDKMKGEIDNPSIGIILCKSNDKVIAEYALRNLNTPIGISEYRLTETIPENFRSKLPTIEELENQLEIFEEE